MLPTNEQVCWNNLRWQLKRYDERLCPGTDVTLIVHGDLSGHLNVGNQEQVTSFANPVDISRWMNQAVFDPTSVGVHCVTELETISKRVLLEELEELLYTILDRDETVELYREDIGLVTIEYCAKTGLWYADHVLDGTLSCEFGPTDVVENVLDVLSKPVREHT